MRLRKGGRVSDFSELGESKDLFELLEQRIEALAERHRESLARARDLEAELRERDEIIRQLTERLSAIEDVRDQVLERIGRLIGQLDALDRVSVDVPEAPERLEVTEANA